MALTADRRSQLDGIVQKMDSDGASTPEIQSIVDDFKSKYDQPVTAQAAPAREQDAFEKAVNYKSGNPYGDAALGLLVQGPMKGAAELGTTIGAVTRYALGKPQESAEEKAADTKPNSGWQTAGKFLEQGAEFMLPAGAAGAAVKTAQEANIAARAARLGISVKDAAQTGAGMRLLGKAAAQAGTGAAVSAAQTQGDPKAVALGAGLGAAGEGVGAGIRAIAGKKVASALEASAEKNYAKAINPTTKANKAITMETVAPGLRERGVVAGSLEGLQQKAQEAMDLHGGTIDDYMQAHGDEKIDLSKIVDRIDQAIDSKAVNGKISPPNRPYVSQLSDLKNHLLDIATDPKANSNDLTLEQLRKIRQDYDIPAAARNAFALSPADRSSLKGVVDSANILRSAVADGRPELKAANKEFSFWADVDRVSDATLERRVGQKPGLGGTILKGAGIMAGATHGPTAAYATGKSLEGLSKIAQSTAWNSISAQVKNQIAEMVKSGNAPGALNLAKRALIQGAQTGNATLAQAQ